MGSLSEESSEVNVLGFSMVWTNSHKVNFKKKYP